MYILYGKQLFHPHTNPFVSASFCLTNCYLDFAEIASLTLNSKTDVKLDK